MSFWQKLFGSGNRGEKATETLQSLGDAAPPTGVTMMTPKALEQFVQSGLVSSDSLTHRCGYREFRGEVWHCPKPAMVVCGACGNGRCLAAYHVYTGFCTLRDSSPFDAAGSKFFYRCESCCDFLCVDCLGIANDYPCAPGELEGYPFRCPNCGGLVKIIRADGVDYKGIAELLASCPSRMLRLSSEG